MLSDNIMGVFQRRAPVGAVCLVSGLCKNDLYSRHVVSFPTEMSWQGNLAARSSAGCLDPVSIRMKTACYIKPNSFVPLQIGRAQKWHTRTKKNDNPKNHVTDIFHDIFQRLAQSIILTLQVQKRVSWRYQYTLCLKTVKSVFTPGRKVGRDFFFLTFGFSDFEEPCW